VPSSSSAPSTSPDHSGLTSESSDPTEKVATPVRVEAKVWFANERTWISYLSTAVLTSTLSLGLWNASDDHIGKWFALVYAAM
jgi:hypothetical protein